jgi:ectoine hydroxylase-related dioxygenase (phytanoyl-CoA dioxygenase family)
MAGQKQLIPGSHKSNIIHPAMDSGGGKIEYDSADSTAQDAFESAVEIHQKAGDVLLFVRALR